MRGQPPPEGSCAALPDDAAAARGLRAPASEPASAPIAATHVDVSLGGRRVLHDVTFAPRPGWTAVVGPNGAGKSTLLRVLAGLQVPSAGSVTLGGTPLARWRPRERARRISWLAQHDEPPTGELTVAEVVALGRLPWLGLFAAPSRLDADAVERAMHDAGCAAWRERRLDALSGGERQRVLIARVLAVGAPLVLLDEPTTHVDVQHQVALMRVLRVQADAGRTVVSALHDLTLALAADRVLVLAAGGIRALGDAADPALHAALVEVFGGAIRIEPVVATRRAAAGTGLRWAVLPELEER